MATALRHDPQTDSPPLDIIAALFRARGWTCETGRDGVTGTVQGSWTRYDLRAVWRQEDPVLQILALPDIRIVRERQADAHHLLALVNEQLWLGHFDLWSDGGILCYRSATMLGGDGLLGLDQAQALIENAIEECDRFYPAFQFVLWGNRTPAEALAAALVDHVGEA